MRGRSKYLVFAMVVGLFAASASAQTTGSIEGTVTDENGVALPGVTVEASSANLQGNRVVVTDSAGKFRLVLLPPGSYTVKAMLSGFSTTESADVVVGLGRTVVLNVQMRSAFEEEVVVSGAAPTIDTRSSEMGANLSKDFFTNLPIGRNYASVVQVAPGTSTDNSGIVVYGSSGAENAYYIDGVNTTGIELGQQGKRLNFEFIQEVQVKTGSYNAEFGRATGGLINVITKSGGNELAGTVFGYYDPESLRSGTKKSIEQSAATLARSFTVDALDRRDFGADLGGYVIKDALWFYGAYNYVAEDEDQRVSKDFTPFGGPAQGKIYTQKVRRDLWSGKLTWRASQNHSLVLSAFGDPSTQDGPARSLAGPETTFLEKIKEGGTDSTLKYEGVLGASVVVNAQVARHREKNIEDGPGFNMVQVIDFTNPLYLQTGQLVVSGGLGFAQRQKFGRDDYRADLSYFLNNFGGDHEFKIGAEYEEIDVDNRNYNTGGERIYKLQRRHAGTGQIVQYYRHRFYMKRFPTDLFAVDSSWILNPQIVTSGADSYSTYLQDSWRLTPALTLNLGVRYEQQRLYDNANVVQAKIKNTAPRFGFIWDFKGDGTSKLFGSYGRFYEMIPMDMVIRSFGGEITAFFYNYSPRPGDVFCDPDVHANVRRCAPLGHENTPVDPDLKGQYIDEIVFGTEYEVARNLAVGAKYIWRDLGMVIEDSLGFDQGYYIGNPGRGVLRESWDMNYERSYPVPDPKRTFKGFELSARKRFADNWGMIASYLWSKLEGNYDGTFQASTGQLDPNLNSAFDYAEFQVNNTGKLSNDRTHQFKLDGFYNFPMGLNLGLSAYYRSGVPITAMGYSLAYQNWEFYLSERGAFGRTNNEYEINLHVDYPFKLGSVQVTVLADIFNLLNRQGETGRNMRYDLDEDYTPINYDTGAYEPPIRPGDASRPPTNPAFNTANRWQDPRSIRLGVRVAF